MFFSIIEAKIKEQKELSVRPFLLLLWTKQPTSAIKFFLIILNVVKSIAIGGLL